MKDYGKELIILWKWNFDDNPPRLDLKAELQNWTELLYTDFISYKTLLLLCNSFIFMLRRERTFIFQKRKLKIFPV